MPALSDFHNVSFPLSIALGSSGGPERRTEIVALASGHEIRNSRWADSRRRYDAGTGVKSLDDLHKVIAFFEERRGRLYGFRFRDRSDFKSCKPSDQPSHFDQTIGIGNGIQTTFQLKKRYGGSFAPYDRDIEKPVAGSVVVAVDGEPLTGVTVSTSTGVVTLPSAPPSGAAVTAGFLFDVPVRFDTDRLSVNLSHFSAGDIPSIPLIEVRP